MPGPNAKIKITILKLEDTLKYLSTTLSNYDSQNDYTFRRKCNYSKLFFKYFPKHHYQCI